MKDSITPHTIATLAVMLRAAQSSKKPILLVEGETDDLVLQHSFGERIQVLPAHGKHLACEGAKVLHDEMGHRDWFLAIVDADFDHILEIEIKHPSILVSELHDLECEYIKSRALEKTLREHGSAEKMQRLFNLPDTAGFSVLASHVRTELHKPAAVLGALRLLSVQKNLNLSFKKLRHEKVLSAKTIDIDKRHLVETIRQQNVGIKVDTESTLKEIDNILGQHHDPWQLCQGHDLVKVFCLGLRRIWSSKTLDVETVESSLRLAFEFAFLSLSQPGRSLVSFVEEFERRAAAN